MTKAAFIEISPYKWLWLCKISFLIKVIYKLEIFFPLQLFCQNVPCTAGSERDRSNRIGVCSKCVGQEQKDLKIRNVIKYNNLSEIMNTHGNIAFLPSPRDTRVVGGFRWQSGSADFKFDHWPLPDVHHVSPAIIV